MKKLHFLLAFAIGSALSANALDPTATDYTFIECRVS